MLGDMAIDTSELRRRAGVLLTSWGRQLQEADDVPLPELVVGAPTTDHRPKMSTPITVILSHHAVQRYGERTGRVLDRELEIQEIERVWDHVVITSKRPEWLDAKEAAGPGVLWAVITDFAFVLVPYEGRDNTFVATTVLARVGARGAKRSAGIKRRRIRSGNKVKRRKPNERPRPRDEEYY